MAEISLTRREVIASSLLVAGALACGASVAPASGFDAAVADFDASLAALNAVPEDDEDEWSRLGDAHSTAAVRLAELPAPDLRQFRAKMQRVVEYYSHRDICMIEKGHAGRLLDDLARLVPA